MNSARSALQRLAVFLALESVIALAVIIVLGSFIGDHIAMVRFAVPAAALDLFEIATLIVLIQQIRLALCIDYGKPLPSSKSSLNLFGCYISVTSVDASLAPLLWTPLLIVALEGFLRVDAYKTLGAAYCSPISYSDWPSSRWRYGYRKKFGDRMDRSRRFSAHGRKLAGYNLNAASNFLCDTIRIRGGEARLTDDR